MPWLKMKKRDRPDSHGTGRSMTKSTTIRARLTLKSATYCDGRKRKGGQVEGL